MAATTVGYVCPPDHKHDARSTCYTLHKCRCGLCRAENTRRKDEERRLKAYGRWDRSLISPWAAATHIHVLLRFGYTQELIARRAGISPRTVHRIIMHLDERIKPRVSRGILAIEPTLDDLDPRHLIDSRGMRRRVQALACLGWSVAALARRLDITRGALSCRIHSPQTTVASHRALADLYEQLCVTPPVPVSDTDAAMIRRTRSRAAAAGWVPPLGWDDIDTDYEPPAGEEIGVDLVAVDLVVDGYQVPLTREERLLALGRLHAAGHLDGELAQRLSVCTQTIARDRQHLGLPANFFEAEDAA